MTDTLAPIKPGFALKWIGVAVIVLLLFCSLLFGGCAAVKSFGRAQNREDARNRVKISEIEIQNQEQRIQITIQKAEIRRQEAIGIREAQEEIAKTLTPLYVQFEMVDALKQIALSGDNNSTIFIPSGNGGIPIITDALTGAAKAGGG